MLTSLQTSIVIQWVQAQPNGVFKSTTQGVDGVDWNTADLAVGFTEVYAGSLSIAASATTTLDLTALENLVYTTFTFTSLLYLFAFPSGSSVKVGPGASNGLQIFGSTNTVTTPANGVLFWSGDPAGAGLTVDSTHKTVALNNPGGTTLTLEIVLVGASTT